MDPDRAIEQSWQLVGQSLYKAIKRYEQETRQTEQENRQRR